MRASRNPGTSCRARAAANRLRCVSVGQSARSQAVETKNALVVCVINCEKGLRGTRFMALAGVTLEEVIHGRVATIDGLPIMLFRDWLFVPCGNASRWAVIGQLHVKWAAPSAHFQENGRSYAQNFPIPGLGCPAPTRDEPHLPAIPIRRLVRR